MRNIKTFKQFLNEELLNAGNLPTPTDELTDMLRMKNQSFRNRIIVNIDLYGDKKEFGWFEYVEDYFGSGEWEEISYGDYKKTTNIVFDQDVLPGSEDEDEAKAWKKWLIGMSKKRGFAYKVKEVYLGDI